MLPNSHSGGVTENSAVREGRRGGGCNLTFMVPLADPLTSIVRLRSETILSNSRYFSEYLHPRSYFALTKQN
jgi:hypothetical protein